jgi:hypothetical protein
MRLLVGQEDSDGPYYTIPDEDILLAIDLVKEQFTSYCCRGKLSTTLANELSEEICAYEGLLELKRIHERIHT